MSTKQHRHLLHRRRRELPLPLPPAVVPLPLSFLISSLDRLTLSLFFSFCLCVSE
ncbi:hypothetical protein Hanom_Chr02g00132581 [Helianthus anomalus]